MAEKENKTYEYDRKNIAINAEDHRELRKISFDKDIPIYQVVHELIASYDKQELDKEN